MAEPQQRRATKQELDSMVQHHRIDAVASVSSDAVKWLSLVAIAAFTYLSIDKLAGKFTFAQIGITLLGEIKVSEACAYIFGVGGVGYGLRERQIRRTTIERLTPRQAELEQIIDPNRTSSRLTPRGTTSPEDRL